MSEARESILASVRSITANAGKPAPAPREYRRVDQRSRAQLVELFFERVGHYKAQVQRVGRDQLAQAVVAAASMNDARRIAMPAGIPPSWFTAGVEAVRDDGLTARDLDLVDGVLTGCTVAIAETGTIALSGGEREGRRLLSLVPDLHICVVDEDQIVGLVPEALELLGGQVRGSRRPVTLISGPSATSDIELQRVEGVHGPRKLVVLITQESA
jgi:L-lactate dehydrogenase complex protein LldG